MTDEVFFGGGKEQQIVRLHVLQNIRQCESKLSKVFQRKAAEKEEKGGISISINISA